MSGPWANPTPIYRELYHKHNLGRLLDEAYTDEWQKARTLREGNAVPWAAIVGIAAMLDVDPRAVTNITMESNTVTVTSVVFDSYGKFAGVTETTRPIEKPKAL